MQVWAIRVGLWKLHVGSGKIGEAWAYPTSELQLFGFGLLLLGTLVYAQVKCGAVPVASLCMAQFGVWMKADCDIL